MKKHSILSGAFVGLMLLLLYAPILILAVYSFTDAKDIGTIRNFSWHNYVTLFTTEELTTMIWGSLALALGSAFLATILGTLGAIGTFYSKRGFQTFVGLTNQVPVVNADVVTGFSLCVLLVVVFHVSKDTYIPLVVGHVVLSAPFVYLSVLPKLKQMDSSLYEAALDLGARPMQALTKVTLPQIFPGVLSGFGLAVTLSLDDYFVATYTKPATFDTISTYVVNATKGSQTETKTALWALSTLIFVVVLFIALSSALRERRKSKKSMLALLLLPALLLGTFAWPNQTLYAQELVDSQTPEQEATASEDTIVLRVCNWEEYMDLGDWDQEEAIQLESGEILGVNPMYEDFEDWYYETYGQRVKVEYSCFGTNEELYNMLTLGDQYDLVCPSEYMIMKLMAEGKLQAFSDQFFDESIQENYYIKGVSPFIRTTFENNEINGESWDRYAAGYMWGVTGILYNPAEVTEEEASTWTILTNQKFKNQITVKDNVRDTFFAGVGALKADQLTSSDFLADPDYQTKLAEAMNDVSQDNLDAVCQYLQEVKDNVYSFETDSGKADMITGKVVAGYQWSGDAVYAMDQAEEDDFILSFAVPEESTNLYFDGWVMLKDGIAQDSRKQQAAEAFINFLSMPENAVRNMYYIGYTSCISGGDSSVVYDYLNWCYGAEEDQEDTVSYPLGYFFSGDNEDPNYIMTVSREQIGRQLTAQYPPEEVMNRSAIMRYFDEEESQRINQMWIDVRCLNLHSIPLWALGLGGFGFLALLVLLIARRMKK